MTDESLKTETGGAHKVLQFGWPEFLLVSAAGITVLWWFYQSEIGYLGLLTFGFLWAMTGFTWGRER